MLSSPNFVTQSASVILLPSFLAYVSKSVEFAFFANSSSNCFLLIASVSSVPASSPFIFLLTVISFSFNVIFALFSPDDIDVISFKSPLTSTLNVAFLLASSFVNVTVVFVPFAISNVSFFILKSFVVVPFDNFNVELANELLTFFISFVT
ncbi:hypothetical protein [Sneathia sanguinegens]|nr:hypothetical protein [Sneathia sanguinegens]